MAGGIAIAVLFAILGSPLISCVAMLTKLATRNEHACCHKKPQPEPKCCLLNPAVTGEPASRESATQAAVASTALSGTELVISTAEPSLPISVPDARAIYLRLRSLRL